MYAKVNNRVENTVHVVECNSEDLGNLVGHLEMECHHQDLGNTDNHTRGNDAGCCDDDFGQLNLAPDDDGDDDGVQDYE